jgi:hypothetical protein
MGTVFAVVVNEVAVTVALQAEMTIVSLAVDRSGSFAPGLLQSRP